MISSNKTEMNFKDYSITKPSQEWFESSCNMWVDYYNFMLGMFFNTEADNAWYQDQLNANKLYDV
jgi:hypothetical protein